MSRMESELGLSRSALVALALLLGCDYCPRGVPGVGRESALKLFRAYQEQEPGCDPLQKMRSWREGGGGRFTSVWWRVGLLAIDIILVQYSGEGKIFRNVPSLVSGQV